MFHNFGMENGGFEGMAELGIRMEHPDLPQDVLLWLSQGPNEGQFSSSTHHATARYSLHTDAGAVLGMPPRSQIGQYEQHCVDQFQSAIHGSPGIGRVVDFFSEQNDELLLVNSTNSPGDEYSCSSQALAPLRTSAAFLEDSFWTVPPQISMVYGNSHGDMPFLDTYETFMPTLLTSKSTPWNPYNYMLNSTRINPESPLRHGILSWTCSYISCKKQNVPYSETIYYVSASTAVKQSYFRTFGRATTCWKVL
jgi:hypothetical protein